MKTVPVLVCFSTGGAGVLDPLNVRFNVLLHVSSCLPAHNRFSANSTYPRSIRLSAMIQTNLVKDSQAMKDDVLSYLVIMDWIFSSRAITACLASSGSKLVSSFNDSLKDSL